MSRSIRFRRPSTDTDTKEPDDFLEEDFTGQIEESKLMEETVTVELDSSKPLGMRLEPISTVQDGEKVKEMGCRVIGFSETETNQARDSGRIQPGDLLAELDGNLIEGLEYHQIIALLKKPQSSSDGTPKSRSIKFRRSSTHTGKIEGSEKLMRKAFTVELDSSKPLGMRLEPISTVQDGEKVKTMGCRVLEFSETETNQARDSERIQSGDIIVELDGNFVAGFEYPQIIALLKIPRMSSDGTPMNRSIKFHRLTTDTESDAEFEETTTNVETFAVEFESSKPLGMILDPVTSTATSSPDEPRKECGCRVMDFSKSGNSQALEMGVINIGDVIVAIDGTDVSSDDYPYADIIALLKKKPGGIGKKTKTKTVTFRRVVT